jgi:hypothetical protein
LCFLCPPAQQHNNHPSNPQPPQTSHQTKPTTRSATSGTQRQNPNQTFRCYTAPNAILKWRLLWVPIRLGRELGTGTSAMQQVCSCGVFLCTYTIIIQRTHKIQWATRDKHLAGIIIFENCALLWEKFLTFALHSWHLLDFWNSFVVKNSEFDRFQLYILFWDT